MTADEFREAMDNDKAFQSKRKALVFVSLLLLALVVSGAQIKEANTFIFKIEFSNHVGLRYLLVVSVVACMLRYYSYAEKYRNQLFVIWSGKLLADSGVYYLDQEIGAVTGVLGGRLGVVFNGSYDLDNPVYKKTGLFSRAIGFRTSMMHDFYGEVYTTKYFKLNDYGGGWKRRDLFGLLLIEFKYRVEAWIKYRETLDLWSPYLLGICSLLVFAIGLWRA